MSGDNVAKTLTVLFLIALAPCLLAGVVAVVWLWMAAIHA